MAAKTYAEWIKSDDKTIPLSMSLAKAAWNAATEAAEEKFTSTNSTMMPCHKCKWSKGSQDYCSRCRWSFRDYFEAQHQ